MSDFDDTTTTQPPGGEPKSGILAYLITSALGFALLLAFGVFEHVFPNPSDVVMLVREVFLREIGIACIVAVVVALMFDKAYHYQMFGLPLQTAERAVLKSTDTLQATGAKIRSDFSETLAKNKLLTAAANQNLYAIHRRNAEYQESVKETLRRTQRRLVLVGRIFTEMLGQEKVGKGWLLPDLVQKLRNTPGLQLHILLANSFDRIALDEDEGPAPATRFAPNRNNAARDQMHPGVDSRRHILALVKLLKNEKSEGRIKIRFLRKYPVPYCLLLTDERVFVEHYLPSHPGGAVQAFEFESSSDRASTYKAYENDFENRLFEDAEECHVVLERFIKRKTQSVDDRYEPHRADELREAIEALAIAREWAGLQALERDAAMTRDAQARLTVGPAPYRRHRNRAFTHQIEADQYILEYIATHEIRNAILIHYSGAMVKQILLALTKSDADVDLYVQDPQSPAIGERQRQRIQQTIDHLDHEIITAAEKGRLTLRQYWPPASLRAVWLDDACLFVGPYLYTDTTGMDELYPDDRVRVHGHDAPGLLLWAGTHEYDVFADAIRKLAANFRRHATSERHLGRPAAPQHFGANRN